MRRAWLVAIALAAALGFAALGIWQVERRAWKESLIARVDASLHAAPTPYAGQRDFPDYRRISLRGTWLGGRDTLVKAVTERGEGYWLLTPLRTAHGIVLINRGFVPSAASAPHIPDMPAAIVGLVRASEPRGGFLRSNDPQADRWYSRDVAAIARTRRLGSVAPFFVDADATPNPGGYPVGGLTVIAFPNNHLIYALTWFALAGMCAAAVVIVRQNRG